MKSFMRLLTAIALLPIASSAFAGAQYDDFRSLYLNANSSAQIDDIAKIAAKGCKQSCVFATQTAQSRVRPLVIYTLRSGKTTKMTEYTDDIIGSSSPMTTFNLVKMDQTNSDLISTLTKTPVVIGSPLQLKIRRGENQIVFSIVAYLGQKNQIQAYGYCPTAPDGKGVVFDEHKWETCNGYSSGSNSPPHHYDGPSCTIGTNNCCGGEPCGPYDSNGNYTGPNCIIGSDGGC